MTVVRNEYESGENSPFGVLMKRMQSVAYDWHSYGRSTIGNRSDIENVRIKNLQDFYRTWYQPDNAVLLVAGKFDAGCRRWRRSAPVRRDPEAEAQLPAVLDGRADPGRRAQFRRAAPGRRADRGMLGYKVPSGLHDDSDVMSFSSAILGDVPTGRLHKQLVETGKASQVFTFGETGYAPGLQSSARSSRRASRSSRCARPDRGGGGFAKHAADDEEMARVRRNYAEQHRAQPERSAAGRRGAVGDHRAGRLAPVLPAASASRPSRRSRWRRVAKRYFKRDNRVTGTFLPEDAPQRAVIPPAPSVAEHPEGLQAESLDPGLGRLRADPGQHHEAHRDDHGGGVKAGAAAEEEPRRDRHGRPAPAHGATRRTCSARAPCRRADRRC
jgi:zinc protease